MLLEISPELTGQCTRSEEAPTVLRLAAFGSNASLLRWTMAGDPKIHRSLRAKGQRSRWIHLLQQWGTKGWPKRNPVTNSAGLSGIHLGFEWFLHLNHKNGGRVLFGGERYLLGVGSKEDQKGNMENDPFLGIRLHVGKPWCYFLVILSNPPRTG